MQERTRAGRATGIQRGAEVQEGQTGNKEGYNSYKRAGDIGQYKRGCMRYKGTRGGRRAHEIYTDARSTGGKRGVEVQEEHKGHLKREVQGQKGSTEA